MDDVTICSICYYWEEGLKKGDYSDLELYLNRSLDSYRNAKDNSIAIINSHLRLLRLIRDRNINPNPEKLKCLINELNFKNNYEYN